VLFMDGIWELVQLCWVPRPGDRISAKDVLLGLERNSSPLRPSSSVNGDVRASAIQPGTTARNSGILSSFDSRMIVNLPTCDTQIF